MTIEEYLNSNAFFMFEDEALRQNACDAVERFLQENRPVEKTQLHSIPAVIQAKGLGGIRKLIENQKSKNTKEENQKFWQFVFDLLFGVPGPEFSFRSLVQDALKNQDLLQDEASVSEKAHQKKIKKVNKDLLERVMNHTIAIYFEHFNCHYFYQTRRGA